jgi:hypothetical protein
VLAALPAASSLAALPGLTAATGSSPASGGPAPAAPVEGPPRGSGGRGLPPEYYRALRRVADGTDAATKIEGLSEAARLGKAASGPDLLAAARGSKEEAVRERAIVLLGDVGARETLPPVLELYDRETDPTVREAIVRATGLLGDATDVPWLVAQASDPSLAKPLAFALARVRTDPALVALREVGRRARAATPPDDETARLVEYLQTPAFVEAERAAGRTVGPRPLLARTPAAKSGSDATPEPPCPKPER